MKRTLCLFLALILAVGICFSAPVTITASAAAAESDFEYEENDGGITIYWYNGSDSEIVIPDTIGGMPVTTIGSSAFYDCTSLTTIEIPDSVTTIGSYAFYGCTSLTTIEIPDSVTTIGSSAFYGCTSLTTVNVPCNWDGSIYEFAESKLKFADHDTTKTATCISKAECSVCGEYGDFAPHTYENGKGKCTVANCDNACAHETITDGVCVACGGKHCGKTENDKVVWFYDEYTATLTITGSGAMVGEGFEGDEAPWLIEYTNSIEKIDIEDGVTSIGDSAFWGCDNLTSVTIPKSVTEIGNNAFYGCTNILLFVDENNINVRDYATDNNINYVVDGSGELEKLTFTLNDDSKSYSVTDCDESISGALKIPATYSGKPVTEIGNYAFGWCSSLTSVTIPDSVTTIGNFAFRDCIELTSVTIGDNVEEIGEYAFSYCEKLTSVTIPDSVTAIGEYAFSYCEKLTSVTIPDRVTTISESVFASCISLTSVTIGKGVTTIAEDAFRGCISLTTITVDDANKNYSSVDDVLFNKEKTELIYYPLGKDATSYTIPDGVKSIGDIAFYGCTSLESVTIPDSVTTIGERVFAACRSLTSVTIPDSVTTIGESAFYGCSELTSVKIGNGVTEIDDYAFDGCNKLSTVNVPCSWNENPKYTTFANSVTVDIPKHNYELGVCTACGEDCAHTGGTATCTTLAVCSVCGVSYGEFGDHTYENGKGKCTVANCDNACAHETITDGVCVACGGKHCGNTENDKVVWFCDATDDAPGDENDETLSILTITGTGDLAGYTIGEAPWEAYRESIRGIDIKDGVTSIGIGTFCGCVSLTSVIIPGSVKIIGVNAFSGCESLSNVRISDGVISIGDDVFKECIALKEITIPESVETIGEHAFNSCTMLMTITIPQNVRVIGEGAFCNCTRLTEINVDEGNTTYSSEDGVLFNEGKTELICCPAGKVGDYEVPSGVTSISNYAFSSRGEIFTVTIPVSVTTIGDYAFAGSQNVNLIVEPGSKAHEFAITNNIPYTFKGYNEAETAQIEKLTFTEIHNDNNEVIAYSVTARDTSISGALKIPATYNGKPVTEIGNNAFSSCMSLLSVTIPESVTAIGSYAFDGCAILASISVDDANTKYSSEDGVLFNKDKTELICYPTGQNAKSYTIPDSVTTIGEDAFRNCTELTSVTIGESVTTIGESAFYGCSQLASITIPESVTTIGEYAFYGCTALETVTIPGIETTIGDNAFSDCPKVTLLVEENSNAYDYALGNNIEYITYVGGSGELGKLTFSINEDGESYSVTDCDKSISGALTIPNEFNGKSVTKIGNNAFSNCKSLTSVVIPDSVVSLGEMSFYDCGRLETVTLSSNITEIPKEAFACCKSLKTLPITENITSIGECAFNDSGEHGSVSLSGVIIGTDAFRSCGITELTLENCELNGENIFANNTIDKLTLLETKIPDKMFYGDSYIKTLVAEDSVLGSESFKSCHTLKSVTVFGGEINAQAFLACSSLETVTIDNIDSVGEFAFNNCTALKTVEVNAAEISAYAFSMCTSLENVKLSDGVEVIRDAVFEGCDSLAELELPETVTEISDGAFAGCSNLKYIFFEGTEDSQKTIGDAIETNARIHYGSSTHTFNENYTVDKEPTCTEVGRESQHCKYCEETQNSKEIKENGHTSVKGGTEKAHTICDVCEEVLSATHNPTSKVTTAPTCTEEGVETFTCECGYTYTKPVATLGHDKVSHSAKSATCEAIGWYAYDTCSRCDYTTYKEIAKLGHDIVIDKAVEATCTATGLTEGSHCSRCNGATKAQQTIAKKGHTEVIIPKVAPTLTSTGLTEGKKCSVCGTVTVSQQVIAKLVLVAPVITSITSTTGGVKFTWGAVPYAAKYKIYRKTYHPSTGKWDAKWKKINKVEVKGTEYVDSTAKLGTQYMYLVKAVNGKVTKNSAASSIVTFKISPTPTIHLKSNGIKVKWAETVVSAENYRIYRAEYNESTKKYNSYKKVKTVKGTTKSWTDTSVKSGKKYKYCVKAVRGSVVCDKVQTKPIYYLTKPKVTVATATNGIVVNWSAKGASKYRVYRSELQNGVWSGYKEIATPNGKTKTYTDTTAVAGVQYKYKIKAVKSKTGIVSSATKAVTR